jgi:hypothetical protein
VDAGGVEEAAQAGDARQRARGHESVGPPVRRDEERDAELGVALEQPRDPSQGAALQVAPRLVGVGGRPRVDVVDAEADGGVLARRKPALGNG